MNKFQRKIWIFESRQEAIEFLLENTNNQFYNQNRLRNSEIESRAMIDGFVIAINEVCPINRFKTGFNNEDELKRFLKDNETLANNEIAWVFQVFNDLLEEKNNIFKNIPPYRLAYTTRLKMTYMPFCVKAAETIRNNPEIKDIELENLLVNTIIQLEGSKENYMRELVLYKQRFGELS